MRLWSIHPKYLDPHGLVALWREGLLARKVLLGKTIGYKNHPQLDRFKLQTNPLSTLDVYLQLVYKEADARGYAFDKNKINLHAHCPKLIVSRGQLDYEFRHLLKKLKKRNGKKYRHTAKENPVEPHSLFNIIEGDVEKWEKLSVG
jgi:hypothetical protein